MAKMQKMKGFKWIEGKTELVHGFGDMIGQVEIDHPKFKSLKAEYYVVNGGNHILQIMSNTFHKTALKQVSSIGQEINFNSNVTVLTPDFCPIVGKSTKFTNLCYNFGAHNLLFENGHKMQEFYTLNA